MSGEMLVAFLAWVDSGMVGEREREGNGERLSWDSYVGGGMGKQRGRSEVSRDNPRAQQCEEACVRGMQR